MGTIKPLGTRDNQPATGNQAIELITNHHSTPWPHGCNSIQDYIKRLPTWHRRMLTTLSQPANDLHIWRAFWSQRRHTIASDGGIRKGTGTFGWTISSKSRTGDITTLFEGSGPIDGPCDIASSTRSELGGLVAQLLLCSSLAAYWGLRHRCKYRWLTNSKAAISRVEFITQPTHKLSKAPEDKDYMTAIKHFPWQPYKDTVDKRAPGQQNSL